MGWQVGGAAAGRRRPAGCSTHVHMRATKTFSNGVVGLGVYSGLGNQAGHTCKEVDSAGLAGTVVGRGQGCARSPRGCERDPTQTV